MLLRVPAFASSLRFRLSFATALAVLLSMATFIALSYAVSRRGALDALSYSLTNVTQVHAKLTAAWIDTQRRIVEAAAQLGDDADRPQSLVQALSSGHFFTTYVAYPDKRFIAAPKVSVPADFDPTSRDWYRQAVQARGGIVTEPYVDAGTGSLVLTFAHARMHNGAVRDVTGADVYLDSVARHIAAARPTENGFALLISASGTILAHADSALWMKPLTALDPSLDLQRIQEASGQSRWMEMSVNGEAHYLHAERVEGTQWTLLLAAPQRDVLADLNQRIRVQALALILIVAAVVVLSRRLLGTMLRRLQRVSDAMHLVGSGDADLSHRLPSEGSDEISVIASSFNRFAGQLSGTIQGVRSASDSIATASRQISAGSQDLSRRTEDAASRLQQTASAVTVVANTVRQGAQYADEARQLATQSAEVARHGQQVVQQVVTTMGDIHAASQRVGDIIGVIDSIAFQTNILALNAAVEAARAGEQGRGFAVVAGEVRSLAQRSSEAAREITALIGSSMEGVERGSRLVNDAGALMTDVVASVEQVTAIISQVSTASREQLRGIERVHDAALELDRMTQQNAALSEQSAAAAESLDEQAARLAQLVASFRLHREIAGTDPGGTTLAAGSYATGSM